MLDINSSPRPLRIVHLGDDLWINLDYIIAIRPAISFADPSGDQKYKLFIHAEPRDIKGIISLTEDQFKRLITAISEYRCGNA